MIVERHPTSTRFLGLVFGLNGGADDCPPQRRSPMQIGTGLVLAVVFLALLKA